MKYALLIYPEEAVLDRKSPSEADEILAGFNALVASLRNSGTLLESHRLHRSTTATSVRRRDGDVVLTDGPFADTKEQFGGFFIVDVPSIDEAIEIASRIPTANFGTVEVRAVMEMPARTPA